jgi:FtsP/CotA-like multicopper oxidase with cupredoxin domain
MSDGSSTSLAFSCDVTHADPATPDFVTSTQAAALMLLPKEDPHSIRRLRTFSREFRTPKVVMPDGREIEFWAFTDDATGEVFPSLPIRVYERDLVQVRMKARKNVHTIHHHGIEPDAFNDGVGHTSFEAGEYTYQWQAHHAGTYFYHCHVNTTLHVQMGLWGALIIDPDPADPESSAPLGYKRLFKGGPVYKTVNERIWGVSAVDPRWHELDHAAGLCGEDVGLNDFRPAYFMIGNKAQVNGAISRAEAEGTQPPPTRPPITDSNIALTARQGEPALIRVINANYYPIEIRVGPRVGSTPGEPRFQAEMWSSDGRPFRETTRYSGVVEEGALVRLRRPENVITMSPAERYDFVLNTPDTPLLPGTYPVLIRFLHWLGSDVPFPNRPVGQVRTTITITS